MTATQLGGLFYLLNLALYLELYGDFSRPLEPGIALHPWELVELLGARLLGGRPRDPVWALLAELAGRSPGTPPGLGFRPPRTWRVPGAWLEPVEHRGTWRWSAAGGALRIFHPAGFPVVAVPRTSDTPAAQLRRELRRVARLVAGPVPPPVRGALPREPTRPLARWVARLAAYARARLRAGLALTQSDSLAAILIEHGAQVHVSPSHVDVVMSLTELPIEIRLAGLDRDPGWIPAAGRYLGFHFE